MRQLTDQESSDLEFQINGHRTIRASQQHLIPKEIRDALQHIPELCTLEKFGFGPWAYSRVKLGKKEKGQRYRLPILVKPFLDDMSHFDCFEAAVKVQDTVYDADIGLERFGSSIHVDNMEGVFSTHYFNLLTWGRSFKDETRLKVDATPLFPFYCAKHCTGLVLPSYDISLEPREFSFNSSPPLSALLHDSNVYYSSLRVHLPRMKGFNRMDHWYGSPERAITMDDTSTIELEYSLVLVKDEERSEDCLFLLSIDHDRFKALAGNSSLKDFDRLSGTEVIDVLLSENVMHVIDDLQERGFTYQDKEEYFESKDVLTLERAMAFELFQRDKEHIGNYVRALLTHYRVE